MTHVYLQVPRPELRTYVLRYGVVTDERVNLDTATVTTAPSVCSILSVNFADLSVSQASGERHPRAALLGAQRSVSVWRPGKQTHFAMAFLTPPGVLALFGRDLGASAVDQLVDLGALLGDRAAHDLKLSLSPEQSPADICSRMEEWVMARIRRNHRDVAVARALFGDVLYRKASIAEVAAEHGMTNRQLQRIFRRDFGLTPREIRDLSRLHGSLRAAQRPQLGQNSAEGFADHSHQIRKWRSRLETTPGRYRRSLGRPEVDAFNAAAAADPDNPVFWI